MKNAHMNKKLLFAIITLPLFVACQSKQEVQQAENQTTTEYTQENPYISKTQAQDTPVLEENLSGELITLTASEFEQRVTEIYNSNGFRYKGYTPCIVDFYADWCMPCRQLTPTLEKMATKYKGELIIYKINVDKAREICDVFDIENIPTLMFFNRTEAPRKMVGAPSEADLDTIIQDFLNK